MIRVFYDGGVDGAGESLQEHRFPLKLARCFSKPLLGWLLPRRQKARVSGETGPASGSSGLLMELYIYHG